MKKYEKNYNYIILFKEFGLFVSSFLMILGFLVLCTTLCCSHELLTEDVSNFIVPLLANYVIKIIHITTGNGIISSNDISYVSKLGFCVSFIGLIGVNFFLNRFNKK